MALMKCPDCDSQVSDRAEQCLHCGRSLLLDRYKQLPWSLVLLEASFNDLNLVARLREITGCSQAEAEALRTQTPAVLRRGLPYSECAELAARFCKGSRAGVFFDEDAEDPDYLPHVLPLQPINTASLRASGETDRPWVRPLSFWGTVGSILTALALWWLITRIIPV